MGIAFTMYFIYCIDLSDVIKYITGLRSRVAIEVQESEGIMASVCCLKLTLPLCVGYDSFTKAFQAVILGPVKKSFTIV